MYVYCNQVSYIFSGCEIKHAGILKARPTFYVLFFSCQNVNKTERPFSNHKMTIEDIRKF